MLATLISFIASYVGGLFGSKKDRTFDIKSGENAMARAILEKENHDLKELVGRAYEPNSSHSYDGDPNRLLAWVRSRNGNSAS